MAVAHGKLRARARGLAAALCLGLGAALMFASFFVASEEASGRRLDNSEANQIVDGIVNATKNILHVKNSDSSEPLPFFVGLFSAIAIKLTSSVDDVVWLVPFLIVPNKRKVVVNTVIYIWVCLFQTALALAISHGGVAAINAMTGSSKNAWSADRILTFFAGVSLLGYGAFLGKEWYEENYGEGSGEDDGEEDEEAAAAGRTDGPSVAARKPKDSDEDSPLIMSDSGKLDAAGLRAAEPAAAPAADDSKDGRTSSSLFVVAFLGSLDDLTLFVPMLVGQALSTVSLVLGAFIAAGFIVTLCMLMGMCKPVANFLESIPLCAIVLCFGTFLTVKSLTMD